MRFCDESGCWDSFWQGVTDEDKALVMGLGVGESPLVQQGKRWLAVWRLKHCGSVLSGHMEGEPQRMMPGQGWGEALDIE